MKGKRNPIAAALGAVKGIIFFRPKVVKSKKVYNRNKRKQLDKRQNKE